MTKANSTELIFLVDRSGSMDNIAADMRGGFDNFIKKQKEFPGECRVSLSRFDDLYETAFTSLLLGDVPPLELVPRGMTALLDAMARCVDETGARLAAMGEAERPEKVLFITITDGQENSSLRTTWSAVKERIQRQERDYKWQFIFLGANFDAIATARDLGIKTGNVAQYTASPIGTRALFNVASDNIGAVRSGLVGMGSSLLDQNAYDTALAEAEQQQAQVVVVPATPVTPSDSSGSKP